MDPLVGGALIGGGLDIVGGLIGGHQSQDRAREQMRFQERMSSTAYQRVTADMRKAGLNPMLAYMQGGAQGAPGASGEVSENLLQGASSSARELGMRQAEIRSIEQQINESKAREELAKTQKRDIAMEFGSREVMQKMDQEMMEKLEKILGSSEVLRGAGPLGEAIKILAPYLIRRKPTERR